MFLSSASWRRELRAERHAERTLKMTSSNKVLFYDRKTQESVSRNIEAQTLETTQKDPQGAVFRLTLGQTKFVLERNDKAVPFDDKAKDLFAGKFIQIITKPNGAFVTRGLSTLNASTNQPTAVRSEFDAKMNQMATAYEMACVPFPNREVKAKETWPAKVPITLGENPRKETFDMHLVCTMEGCIREEGKELAVVSVLGELKSRRTAINESYGKVTGKLHFAVDSGFVARANLRMELEVEFGDQALASYIMDVNVTRVIGNTANITPSKDAPRPSWPKEKSSSKSPWQLSGPPTQDYPGRLIIPYKQFRLQGLHRRQDVYLRNEQDGQRPD